MYNLDLSGVSWWGWLLITTIIIWSCREVLISPGGKLFRVTKVALIWGVGVLIIGNPFISLQILKAPAKKAVAQKAQYEAKKMTRIESGISWLSPYKHYVGQSMEVYIDRQFIVDSNLNKIETGISGEYLIRAFSDNTQDIKTLYIGGTLSEENGEITITSRNGRGKKNVVPLSDDIIVLCDNSFLSKKKIKFISIDGMEMNFYGDRLVVTSDNQPFIKIGPSDEWVDWDVVS